MAKRLVKKSTANNTKKKAVNKTKSNVKDEITVNNEKEDEENITVNNEIEDVTVSNEMVKFTNLAWVEAVNMYVSMFANDDGIIIRPDDANGIINITVMNPIKAEALKKLLKPYYKETDIKIAINEFKFANNQELVASAFNNTPCVVGITNNDSDANKPYLIFNSDVVQFEGNTDEPNSYWTGLYADIAKTICNDDFAKFTTKTPLMKFNNEKIEEKDTIVVDTVENNDNTISIEETDDDTLSIVEN